MRYSSAEIFDMQANALSFAQWAELDEDGPDYRAHVKKCVAKAIMEELTDRQRQYFLMYFVDNRTILQIAEMVGVNKSTVSRTLTAAKKKLARVLRYSAPQLINANMEMRNRRVR